MAAEAQAKGPALPPPPQAPLGSSSTASPEKRGLLVPGDDGGGDAEREPWLPEPKRRRACVAALSGVPSSVAEEAEEGSRGPGCGGDGDGDGDGDGASSFSFQHARGGFVALETTPKFGSFNPPGEAELAALDPKPAAAAGHEADAEGSTEADDEVPAAASAPAGPEAKDLLGAEVDDGQVQA